jgi:NDP-sugar pyrophosphorylase family protein
MTSPSGAILCAGFGTRMAPLTNTTPKPLIPFLNTPLLAYALGHMAQAGVDSLGLNTHHLHDAFAPVAGPLCASLGLPSPAIIHEPTIQGTAGGIAGIWRALGSPDAPLIVMNGDTVMDLDLAHHLATHMASGALATLVVRERAPDQPGRVWLDTSGQLCGLRDARSASAPADLTEYDFTGVHILSPELLKTIPCAPGCIVGDVYIPALLAGRKLAASVTTGFWAALDSPALYLDAMRRVLSEPGLFAQAPLPPAVAPGLHLWRTAHIDGQARLGAPALLGLNVRVDGGARVGPNACVEGAHLEADCVVSNAALFGVGRVGGEWTDCIAIGDQIAAIKR